MAFNSFTFLIFAVAVITFYFSVPKRFQWIVLLIASYAFYLFSARWVVVFLLFTTITTFYTGLLIGRVNDNYRSALSGGENTLTKEQRKRLAIESKKQKQIILLIALVVNFGILAFMKYFNFFAMNVNSILKLITVDQSIPLISLLLPLGISFYTFQSAGYIIDVYRDKVKPDKNIAKFALFVSFFPQIVQGPISRYNDLALQLYESHNFDYTRAKFGAQLILWGLFKKMVIADRIVIAVDTIFNNYLDYSGITLFLGAVFYSLQVYCDFSGGIDIARGVAQIMGIELTKNFERPFFATSIADFWRRWHITLGSWTRDYIFYPLSLSKSFAKLGRMSRKFFGSYLGKLLPTFLAMLITFLVIGIWHGASWKFVAYGLYNGVLIFTGILIEPFVGKIIKRFQIRTNVFSWHLFNLSLTFFLVSIGRYFSRANDFMDALRMLKRTFTTFNPWVLYDGSLNQLGLSERDMVLLILAVVVLFVVDLFQERGLSVRQIISEQNLVFRWGVYLLAVFSILIFGIYGIGYEPADFIYMGF